MAAELPHRYLDALGIEVPNADLLMTKRGRELHLEPPLAILVQQYRQAKLLREATSLAMTAQKVADNRTASTVTEDRFARVDTLGLGRSA